MTTDIDKIREKYCLILKRILQFYHEQSSDPATSHMHIRRGILFLQEFPIDAMNMTGVKLWKYKDMIQNGTLGKIKHVATKPDGKKEIPNSQLDIANGVIDNVMSTWRIIPTEEKETFTKQIQELLRLYTTLLLHEKQSN